MPYAPLTTGDGRAPRPVPMREALDRLLASLGSPPASTIDVISGAWAELVGPAAAAGLHPVAVRDGVLLVVADDPVWVGQARWLETSVVEGLAPLLGPGVVTSLRARRGPR